MAKKENKHVEMHWIDGYKLDVDDEDFQEINWKHKYTYVSQSSTKRYYNCLYLLCRLSPCARTYMDYLSEVMDGDNMISTTSSDRQRFIEFISKITKGAVGYSDIAVKKAVRELTDKRLILKRSLSRYKVNPLYFFNGSDAKRIETLKLIIQIGSEKVDAYKYIQSTEIDDSKLERHRKAAIKDGEEVNIKIML